MLDKADVAQRLVEEMDRVGVSPARLAEKTGVTIQAIYGWTSTGRFARKHYDAFRGAGFDLGYILTGQRTPSAVAEADTELPSLSQHDCKHTLDLKLSICLTPIHRRPSPA